MGAAVGKSLNAIGLGVCREQAHRERPCVVYEYVHYRMVDKGVDFQHLASLYPAWQFTAVNTVEGSVVVNDTVYAGKVDSKRIVGRRIVKTGLLASVLE